MTDNEQGVQSTLTKIEVQLATLTGAVNTIDARLGEKQAGLERRVGRVESGMSWVVGLILGLVITAAVSQVLL